MGQGLNGVWSVLHVRPGIPRADYPVCVDGRPVGSVTSGPCRRRCGSVSVSPWCRWSWPPSAPLQIGIRDRLVKAEV
jgi:hypothetical protein